MAAPQLTIQELLQIVQQQQNQLQQQQNQIGQLLTNAGNAAAPNQQINAATNQQIVPPLNDIILFESTNDKSRISDWIDRFTFAIDCAAPGLDDELKVKAMMNKLTENSFAEYAKFVLPKSVTDFDFDETKDNLKKLFARQQSIFVDRYNCLKATKEENEDFKSFVNRHKMLLRNFEFDKMNEQQFMVLMLLLALKAPKDVSLRQRILTKLAQDGDAITYENVVEDCLNFMATIAESRIVENQQNKDVNAIINKGKNKNIGKGSQQPKIDQNPPIKKCWRCGKANHMANDCHFKTAKCSKCNYTGHLQSQCDSVQEWRRKHPRKGNNDKKTGFVQISTAIKTKSSLLKIQIKMNSKPIEFVLDCGS
jgi:ribosomal protein S27AE